MSPTNGVTIYDNSNDYIDITSAGLRVFESGAQVAIFAATTIIGTSTDKVTISDSGITIRENNADRISLSSGNISLLGGTIAINDGSRDRFIIDADDITMVDEAGNTQFNVDSGVVTIGGSADKVVIDSDGIEITENSQVRAYLEPTSVIGSAGAAVTATSTDDCIRIANGTVSIFQDTNNKAVVNSSGLTITQGGVDVGTFGSDTVITGGTLTLRSTGGTTGHERVVIENNSISMFANNAEVFDVTGGVVTIGSSTDQVEINGTSGITIRENDVDTIQLAGGAVVVGEVGASKSNVQITSGAINLRSNTTNKMILGADGSISIGSNFAVTSAGVVTLTGSITISNPEDQGFTKTFRQDGTPTAITVGDLWYDTNDGNKLYIATATGTGDWEATVDGTIATAQTQANTATTTANTANSTANTANTAAGTAQTAIDLMETRVVIDNTGMALKAKNDGSSGTLNGQTLAEYGTTMTLFDGVANADTNRKLELNASGITLWGGAAAGNDYLNLAAGSLEMRSNNVRTLHITDNGINIGPSATGPSSANTPSAVAGNISLHAQGARIYGEATNDYVDVKANGVDVVTAGVTQAAFGATTVIGTSTDKVTIDGTSGITIRENNVDTIKMIDGTITLQTGTSTHEKLVLSDASIAMFSNNAKLVDITDGKVNIGPAANASATLGAVVGNIHLAGTGAYIYGDNTNTFAAVTSAGLEVTEDGVKKAIFGAVSVIGSDGAAVTPTSTDDCIRIANGTVSIFQDNTHKATVTSAGLSVFEGDASVPEAIFGSTTTIGQVADNSTRVQIESDNVKIINRDGDSNDTTMLQFGNTGNVSSEDGFILEKTRLFGAGGDGNVVLKSNECTVANGAGSAARVSDTSIRDENATTVCTRSGTTWTMQGDWYTKNLEVDTSVAATTLITNGFRLFVQNTLTIDANCVIHNDGTAGIAGEAAGADATDNANGGAGGAGNSLSAGPTGGDGGRGGIPTGGGAQYGGEGGGGGGAGGIVFISAATIANSGVIRSHGGAGGAGGNGTGNGDEGSGSGPAAGAAGAVGSVIHIQV